MIQAILPLKEFCAMVTGIHYSTIMLVHHGPPSLLPHKIRNIAGQRDGIETDQSMAYMHFFVATLMAMDGSRLGDALAHMRMSSSLVDASE